MDSETVFRRRWLILAILSLSLIVIGLDILIITIALPDIQSDTGASGAELQWTVNAYTLSFGGLLMLGGSLADRFGRKRLLMAGLLLFLVFSIAATYASSAGMLIFFRAGMGVGSALIMPTTLAIIKNVFPPEEQAKAVGIWTAAAGIGVPLGPVIGGLLLDHFWWGSVFLLNVPVAGFALIAGAILIPESRADDHPGLDWRGAIMSVGGLIAVVVGIIEGPDWGWTDTRTVGLLVAGVALLAAFVAWEAHVPNPMINVRLFAQPRFGGPALAIVCVAFSLFGELFIITQFLQFALELRPLSSGVRMLAICTLILTYGISPQLVARLGLKPAITSGLVFIAASGGVLAAANVHREYLALVALGLLGLGLGLAMPAAADSILASSPKDQSGAGSAVTDTSMQVGGALGVAVIGSVLTTVYRDKLGGLPFMPHSLIDRARDSIGSAHDVAARLGASGDRLSTAANTAFDSAIGTSAIIGCVLAAIGAVISAFLLPRHSPVDQSGNSGAAVARSTSLGPGVTPISSACRRSGSGGPGRRPARSRWAHCGAWR